jgi:hypothetical protein
VYYVSWIVFRIVDGKSAATPVKIGASDGVNTVILGGFKEGDSIVAGPYKVLEHLRHDQKVADEKNISEQQRKAYYDRNTAAPRRGPF